MLTWTVEDSSSLDGFTTQLRPHTSSDTFDGFSFPSEPVAECSFLVQDIIPDYDVLAPALVTLLIFL